MNVKTKIFDLAYKRNFWWGVAFVVLHTIFGVLLISLAIVVLEVSLLPGVMGNDVVGEKVVMVSAMLYIAFMAFYVLKKKGLLSWHNFEYTVVALLGIFLGLYDLTIGLIPVAFLTTRQPNIPSVPKPKGVK